MGDYDSIQLYHDLVHRIVSEAKKLADHDTTTYMSIAAEISRGEDTGLLDHYQYTDLRDKLRKRWEGIIE